MTDTPSDLGRGFKFGIGCALGFSVIVLLLLFGLSMCAGRFQQRALEHMQEMLPKEHSPHPEEPDEIL